MKPDLDQFLPHVKGARVVPWELDHDEWGIEIEWSTGDKELRHVGSRRDALREAARLRAGKKN